jgi:glycosyltransferase involved in cell wall biosynthesis
VPVIAGRVSVLVPSRNEVYLPQTVSGLLAKAHGDIQVIVIQDGYWHQPPLPDDPRVTILHRGTALGLRPAVNAAVQMATGEYLLKVDAHVLMDDGYDEKLKADYHEHNWVLVPRRYALDPERWVIDTSNPKYPIDAHYLSVDLHGQEWRARREARKDIELDDEMSSQGSAYFMSRKCWDWLGPLDAASYGPFYREMNELGLKVWLSGGAMKVTKRTWYAHLHKKERGYSTNGLERDKADHFCRWFWLTDQPFKTRTRSLRWLVEHFAPVPTWPADLDAVFAEAKRTLVAA